MSLPPSPRPAGENTVLSPRPGTPRSEGGGVRGVAPLAAVLLILVGFGLLFTQSEPVGAVEGTVTFARNSQPFAYSRVSLLSESDSRSWRTKTDRQGHFSFRHIPVGTYRVVDSASHHSSPPQTITVTEAKTTSTAVVLKPTSATLELAYTQQRTFGTKETPMLTVTGIGDTGQKISVELYRARLSEVLSKPERALALGRLGNRYGDDTSKLPAALQPLCETPLATDTQAIPRVDAEGFFTLRLPLKGIKNQPGLYFARLIHDKESVWSWVHATDTALVTFRSPLDNRLVAFAAELESGKPRPSTRIQHFLNGVETARGTTDAEGLATLSLPSPQTAGTALLATIGNDETMVYEQSGSDPESQSLIAHTITDRPLYRPGQTVHYKTILRRPTPGSPYAYSVPNKGTAELKLTDPTGLEVLKETRPISATGAVIGEFTLSAEAPTGFYDLQVSVDGQEQTHSIEIASYRKPEFSVKVTPAQTRILRNSTLEATVAATYYFGAPVANAKVHWSLTRETDWSADYDNTGWPSLEEDLAGEDYGSGSLVADGEGRLDGTGRLVLRLPTEPEKHNEETQDRENEDEEAPKRVFPPQTERYKLTAYITDDAQREVESSTDVSVTAAEVKVALTPEGYLARAGQPTKLFVTVRDHEGKPLPNSPVSLRVERYEKKAVVTVVPPQEAKTGEDGRAILMVTLPKSGDIDLIATAKDASGREAQTHQTLWVTPASDGDTDLAQNGLSGLTLATDKRSYAPGETARVVIGAAETGQTAILTIEGERIYKTIAVPIHQNVTTVEVPVLDEYGPNVSLAACYIRNKTFAQTETPLRVTLPRKTLSIALTPDKSQYEPGDQARFDIAITDSDGKPIATELTLSVADEAIYALKEDDPKALRKTFYPHRTSRVRTRHSFEILYLAGDGKDGIKVKTREKFVDTAYWNAALRTDFTGHAKVSFTLPDNLTTWRAVANAITDQTAVGYARAKIIVNRPFFVRLDMPRFVVEGDQVKLSGLVHNNSGQSQTAHLQLKVLGLPIEEKTLTVASGTVGETSWSWTVPGTMPESTEVTLEGWTDTKLTDGVKLPLTVRPFSRETLTNIALAPTAKLSLPADAVPERSFVTIRVAPSLRETVTEATEYLKKYPYGCVEQTVSRFVPLMAAKVVDETLVTAGITRLGAQLQGDNGWGWWYKDAADPWLTTYALWGLTEARDAGYAVPPMLLEKGAKSLWPLLENPKKITSETAFALYVLSRVDGARVRQQGAPKLTALLTRFGPSAAKRPETLAWLTLFCKTVGLDAKPYAAALEKKAVMDGVLAHWANEGASWNATERMTTALATRALLATNPKSPLLGPATRFLLSTQTDGYFGDTRDTAFVVSTLCQLPEYATPIPNLARPQVTLNGKPLTLAKRGRLLEVTVPGTALQSGENSLALAGSGYATATLRQTTRATTLPALEAKGLKVRREYIKLASGPKGLIPEAASTKFTQGDTVRVRLIVEADQPLEYILLEDRFPSGFEPNARGTLEEEDSYGEWNYWYSHIDIRDDRVALFARRLAKGKHVYEYHLRAQTTGVAHALPTALTPMYGTTLRAESTGEQLEIH